MNRLDIERIWRESAGALRRFIAARIENPQDAEDVLQEVFLKIHGGVGKLRDEDRLQPWLYRIARNGVSDYYRRRRLPADASEKAGNPPPDRPEYNLNEEIAGCLRPLIRRLPEKYRRAVMLADLEGLPQQEVAQRLGLSLSGAKSRVQRGRERLKGLLLDCCHFQLDRLGNVLDYRAKDCTGCR